MLKVERFGLSTYHEQTQKSIDHWFRHILPFRHHKELKNSPTKKPPNIFACWSKIDKGERLGAERACALKTSNYWFKQTSILHVLLKCKYRRDKNRIHIVYFSREAWLASPHACVWKGWSWSETAPPTCSGSFFRSTPSGPHIVLHTCTPWYTNNISRPQFLTQFY